MDYNINKDVLIHVLKEENDQLKELVQMQRDQLNNYRGYADTYTQLQVNVQKQQEISNQLKNAYEGAIGAMERQLQEAVEHNIALNKKIEQMQAIIDNKATEHASQAQEP